ncbi:cytoplasmic protein [Streptomyces eurocidicus]|uniref:Cytoplasmic protein n=1 Tax=Streptomyces eurocidicus TaxID=66423 RepID=A0A2N8NXM4_STREU|nr:phenylalanine--tRNA ligase beta subunit-related protein [Streptomyces eurocidicus]MBB5120576.1 DNA/RNA-binding domain of Phe-tRNA-synthetase-like protein [Streptomyces eurocidicus]MBF6053786.1 cytoplasmic protein [Streptomyces eurocidicus]PNE33514.1 cytoplasmic protein [Streptomyces eurocidicus]
MTMDLDAVAESVRVDAAVRALRPDFAVLAIAADGLPAGPTDAWSRGLLKEAADGAAGLDVTAEPHVAAWRQAYTAFGAKPGRTRNSAEALARRAAAGLPEVSLLVDAYNAVSVAHRLPIGGEDLDAYAGAPRLVRAVGDERFDTVASGEPAVEHPEPGEVVWCDDLGVTCRRWNHRQCVRTRITETTTRALFLLERLDPMPLDALAAAGEDLLTRLRERAPELRAVTRLVR